MSITISLPDEVLSALKSEAELLGTKIEVLAALKLAGCLTKTEFVGPQDERFQKHLLGGLLWAVHVAPNWRRHHRRTSGIVSLALLLLLVGSGYLLYYVADEQWRLATSTVHWVLGLAALAPFLVHLLHGRTPHDPEHRPR